MMDPTQISTAINKILPSVKSPGRYTGGEFNQILKNWDSAAIKTALLFPEIYDLAMSNLGLLILYDLINQSPVYLAERVFVPWIDLEAALRREGIPLYSLESKRPVVDFDLLAVSLPYESLYTNFLNALDLAGIPLHGAERDKRHPLVIAGGHAAFNPEPLAPFLDAVAIGEGEEVMLEILAALAELPENASREQKIESLADLEGIYIPSYYDPVYDQDGRFLHLTRTNPKAPDRILKRIVGKLPPPPVKPIVPYIDTVHNRAPLEIMRGCTRGCRFCHAGIVTGPVRERTV